MLKKKAEIGDICEIETPAGLFYVQYTHDGPSMGQLVRVLPGRFDTRPKDLSVLANQQELFFVFYTLNHSLREGQAKVVSRQQVPEWARDAPLMRWSGLRDQSGKVMAWKIFRASDPITLETHQRTPAIRTLSPQQERLSIHQLWPHPVLVRQLARGWTPQRAEEFRLQDIQEASAGGKEELPSDGLPGDTLRHYLYFRKRQNAEKAGETLSALGFSVGVRKGADGENWLTLAAKPLPDAREQMDELRARLEALAAEFDGEYDGWEVASGGPISGRVAEGTWVN